MNATEYLAHVENLNKPLFDGAMIKLRPDQLRMVILKAFDRGYSAGFESGKAMDKSLFEKIFGE